eukprot:1142736-Pelagomonas_calceolata.AAC.2
MVHWSVQSWRRAHMLSTDGRAEMHKPAEVPPHRTPSDFSGLSVYCYSTSTTHGLHHAWILHTS